MLKAASGWLLLLHFLLLLAAHACGAGELATDKVPIFTFTGDYLQRDKAAEAAAAEINGKGFCPWQFPDIHDRL